MTRKRRENIKTFLLVVLFLMTILLLDLLWLNEGENEFSVDDILGTQQTSVKIPEINDILRPDYIAFGFGDGSFRLAAGDLVSLQNITMGMVGKAMENSDAVVNSISSEQFNAVVSDYNSLVIKTCTDLPMADYAAFLGLNHADSLNAISHVSAIVFSDASSESMFIRDGIVNKYYRVLFGESIDFVQMTKEYAALSETPYYLAGAVLGGKSRALIPLESSSSLAIMDYENEYEYGGREMRIEMAEAVFGQNFDFVRRITDSFGNITYMYGYGQKVFTANADGSFAYTSEKLNTYSKGFFADLKLAVEFAASVGGWAYDGGRSALVLREYKNEGNGRASNRVFCFSQYIGGHEICMENGYALTVCVESGQVTSLNRNVIIISNSGTSSANNDVADAPNVIAQNCNHIFNIINNNTLAAATDEAYNFASDAINSLSMAFYRENGSSILTPCWKVETDGVRFYFDLKTAYPLGFTR